VKTEREDVFTYFIFFYFCFLFFVSQQPGLLLFGPYSYFKKKIKKIKKETDKKELRSS